MNIVVPYILEARFAQVSPKIKIDKTAEAFRLTKTRSLSLCSLKADTPQIAMLATNKNKNTIKLIIANSITQNAKFCQLIFIK